MNIVPNGFPALYEAALRLHLMVPRKSSLDPARALGTQALAEGLPAISKRLGIVGMNERAEMIGGSFEIESSPGEGTTVRAQIPFAKGYGQSSKSTTSPTP